MGRTVTTVGHGTLAAEDFAALLREAGIEGIVDVRRYPASRRHPHFSGDDMARWLPDAGLTYDWIEALGGRRKVTPGSPNLGLKNESFRGYGDYMATAAFAEGVAALKERADERPTAVMCAESVWWRCHRRLLADHLVLVAETPVEHLFHDRRRQEHRPTPEARRDDAHVVYDVGVDRPLL